MHQQLCEILVCPDCLGNLALAVHQGTSDQVYTGTLSCETCRKDYLVRNGIPRFVAEQEDYCENFGWQWNKFRRTQIDAFNGTRESEKRFLAETGWRPEEIRGQLILDAGSGAGRFTAIASQYGVRVVAVDISGAVDACAKNMEELGLKAEIIQASLYKLPFRPATFDRIFSLGVLQHTPDPKQAIGLLPALLKPGGRLAYWIYEKSWLRFISLRQLLRHMTRKLPLKANYYFTITMVAALFPFTAVISLVPGLRKGLPLVPIASRHYWGKLSLRQQWEWTVLDTLDTYAAVYEYCQREADVISELRAAGMEDVRRTSARGMAFIGRRPEVVNSTLRRA